jgi:AraC-like DNA-binding protein
MEALDERDVAYLEENFLVWIFMHCLLFLGRVPPVHGVTLRDPLHFSRGLPHWGIGGPPVEYGEVTSFRFPRQLLGASPASRAGENVVWEAHQPWLTLVAGNLSSTAPISFVNASGFLRFSDMVRESGKSANTLRRRFQASNGRFRDARRRALVDAASNRLCASDESVEAIAAELGYSDGRSFRRFLKAATGLTPQQVRDRHGAWNSEEDRRALLELRALSARMNL